MSTINVNTDAFVVMTNKLEKIGKNHLPNAARGLLNSLAMDVKKRTLPNSAKKEFTTRNKGFFKRFSKVEFAKGRDLNSMQSVVGMSSQGLKGSSEQAVEDLEKQERGGTIKGRSFIPLDSARVSKSNSKNVKAINRTTALSDVVNSNNVAGKTKAEKFIKSAIHAGVGGAVIGNFGKNVVWRIQGIDMKARENKIKATPIYTYKEGRSVKVDRTKFSEKAAKETVKIAPKEWIREGERQLKFAK